MKAKIRDFLLTPPKNGCEGTFEIDIYCLREGKPFSEVTIGNLYAMVPRRQAKKTAKRLEREYQKTVEQLA